MSAELPPVIFMLTLYSPSPPTFATLYKRAPSLPNGVVWAKGNGFAEDDSDILTIDIVWVQSDGTTNVVFKDLNVGLSLEDEIRFFKSCGWVDKDPQNEASRPD